MKGNKNNSIPLSETFLRIMLKRFMENSMEYEGFALLFDAQFFAKQAPRQVLLSIQAILKDGLIPSRTAVEQHITNLYRNDEEYQRTVTEYMKCIWEVKDDMDPATFKSEWKETYCTYALSQFIADMGRKVDINKQREGGFVIGGLMSGLVDFVGNLQHEVGSGISATKADSALFNELAHDETAEVVAPFGVKLLDDATGGIRREDVVMVCAKTGGGKTSMMIHIASNAVIGGANVLYLAYEGRLIDIWRDHMYYFVDKYDLDVAINRNDAAGMEKLYQGGLQKAVEDFGSVGSFHTMMAATNGKAGLTGDLSVDLTNIKQVILDNNISVVVVDHVDKLGARTTNNKGSYGVIGRKYLPIVERLQDFGKKCGVAVIVGKQSNGWRRISNDDVEILHLDGLTSLTDDYGCATPATIAFSLNTSSYEVEAGMARLCVFKLRSAAPIPPFVIRTGKDNGIYCGGCVLPNVHNSGYDLVYDPMSEFYINGRIKGVGRGKAVMDAFYDAMMGEKGHVYPRVPGPGGEVKAVKEVKEVKEAYKQPTDKDDPPF